MKQRCTNTKNVGFHRYGGRGIKVCDRWIDSFEAFLEDMGERPSLRHSIERDNNDGNYEPSNCRWATKAEQALNTSRTAILEYDGRKYFGFEALALRLNIKRQALVGRNQRGTLHKYGITRLN